MNATISADIVASTSLKTEDLVSLMDTLRDLINHLEQEIPGFWGRIVKGDSIECFFPNVGPSLRVALLLKLCTKIFVNHTACAEDTKRQGLRFAIGAGSMKAASKSSDLLDGAAIYLSGRQMQKVGPGAGDIITFQMEHDQQGIASLLASIVSLLDKKVNGYTAKQCEVVYWKLLGLKEAEITTQLGITQPTVNSRSSSADWKLVEQAVNAFESFKPRTTNDGCTNQTLN